MSATWEIREGDALARLGEMPGESVQACITSPPYFGLRDYSVDGQIGLEESPDAYVAALVAVFREVRRGLRPDGTLWLNLGDSYNNRAVSRPSSHQGGLGFESEHLSTSWREHAANGHARLSIENGDLKEKDLLGIPWMVAFALRADGWCLRSEIVWAKPNPMPESVTDRPTSAHEKLFLLSKCRWSGAEEPLPMRGVDAAWLAAIVDGEGSICFQDRTTEGATTPTFSVRLSIVNTNRALLERVAAICGLAGVGSPSPRTRSTGESGRPVYAWQVTNAKAARVIAAIRPYLVAKGQQADLALYVQTLNRKHTGRGGHSVNRDDRESKAKAAAACSALNRGEDVDLSWFRPVPPGRWVPLPYAYDAEAIREDGAGRLDLGRMTLRESRLTQGGDWANDNGVREYAGRNRRNVWTVATQAFPDAHFATFPPKLVEPCVLAGSAERACGACGAPWERVVERTEIAAHERLRNVGGREDGYTIGTGKGPGFLAEHRTLGWQPSCEHDDPTGHSLVLDPFAGSGTTGLVALRHNRSFLGIELNPAYASMARERIRHDAPLLNTMAETVL